MDFDLKDLRVRTGSDISFQFGPVVRSGQVVRVEIDLIWIARIVYVKSHAAFRCNVFGADESIQMVRPGRIDGHELQRLPEIYIHAPAEIESQRSLAAVTDARVIVDGHAPA